MRILKKSFEYNFQNDLKELVSLLNTLPYGILLIKPNKEIHFANKYAKKMLGATRPEGLNCSKIFCMDNEIECPIDKNEESLVLRKSMRHNNGDHYPILKTVQPLVINKNKYFLEILTDITNQVEIENELRKTTSELKKIIREKEMAEEIAENEAIKFETLFEEVGDALFVHDLEGNLLKVNQKACDRLGYTREQYSQMNITDIDTPESRRNVKDRLKSIRATKKMRFKATHVTQEGDQIPVEVFSKLTVFDGKEAILSSARNITKQLKYEHELDEARKTAEAKEVMANRMLNNIPASVFTFNKEGTILELNHECLSQFEIERGYSSGYQIGDLIRCRQTDGGTNKCGTTEKCVNCELRKAIDQTIHENHAIKKKEISLVVDTKKTEKEKTFLFSTAILDHHQDKIFLGYLEDITERKENELDLNIAKEKAQESDRLKSQFLNNISHEIRTPLNGIVGFLDLFEQNNLSDNDRKKFIEIMRKSSDRLIETVNAIIDISKFESSSPRLNVEKFLLSDVMDRVVLETNAKYNNPNVAFTWFIDEKLKNQIIETDWQKLLLVINQLISNAFKFTSNGHVHLTAYRNHGNFDLTVEDTGIGIPEEDLLEIFKPFWKSKESVKKAIEGNGIGLTMALKLAHLMGGDIKAHSQVGKGSTFRLTLAEIFRESLQQESETLPFEELEDKTILIAEDDVNNFIYLEAVLITSGCKVLHALNGAQAVEYVASRNGIDVVLMDLRMPVMDGLTATRQIRKTNEELPIIAHSAFVLNNEKAKALEAGCNDYLPKPVNRDELLTAILKHLNIHQEKKISSS